MSIKLSKYINSIYFHFILGIICFFFSYGLVFYLYVLIFNLFFSLIVKKENKDTLFLFLYIVSFELFGRVLYLSPFIPYEFSKYLMFTVFLILCIKNKLTKNSLNGLLLLTLLIPSLFFDLSGKVNFQLLIFNSLGVISLGLAILYFSNLKISKSDIDKILFLIRGPNISLLIYLILKSPSLSNYEFEVEADTSFTGGFGTNQIATVLGLCSFISFYFFHSKKQKLYSKDFIFFVIFIVYSFLSFSRGGLFVAIIGIIVYLLISRSNFSIKWIINPKILLLTTTFLLSFFILNSITDNKLLLRLKGETAATSQNLRVKDLEVITSGRSEIFKSDLKLFNFRNIFGVGVGASMFLRDYKRGESSHVELSRLLAEHGVFGVFIIFIFIVNFLYTCRKKFKSIPIIIVLYLMGILSTFHSATRTFIPILLISLFYCQPKSVEKFK